MAEEAAGPIHQEVVTGDGSKTLSHTRFDATYHSTHGALKESQVVFLENGLQFYLQHYPTSPKILEIGFGTGLNFLLSLNQSIGKHQVLYYKGLDLYPISLIQAQNMGFENINDMEPSAYELFLEAHRHHQIEKNLNGVNIHFDLIQEDFLSYDYPASTFDIIYYDAFGPGVQEQFWGDEMAVKMWDTLSPSGILVTYCVRGAWKRALKRAGFYLEKLPGPPGKREVLRASKVEI